jgi:predicted metal-dependent phosphoesterase TrpH
MKAIDFHIHTHHSYDSRMRPAKILSVAKARGLHGVVISDHDTIEGGRECAGLNTDKDFKVFISSEIKTSVGDITGINLKEEITARNFSEVVQQIKNQGGLVLLVHPYHGHKLGEIDFSAIDLIEGYNSRVSFELNLKGVALAKKHNIPVIAGSDAHLYSEIANSRTWYEDLSDLRRPLRVEWKRNDFYAEVFSQAIKAGKTKSIRNFYQWARWTPAYLLRRLKDSGSQTKFSTQ